MRGKRNQIFDLMEDKYPEELPYINDLTTSFLGSSLPGGTPTLFLSPWVCIPALLLSHLNKPLLSVLSHLLFCFASNNFVPAFMDFASVINAFFTRGKNPGENSF